MKLTRKEKKAVQDSITHWIEDLWMIFLIPGVRVVRKNPFTGFVFESIGNGVIDIVKSGAEFCPLCNLFFSHSCEKCPYRKFYGKDCTDKNQAWNKWSNNPSRKTAEGMIIALEKILEGKKKNVKR